LQSKQLNRNALEIQRRYPLELRVFFWAYVTAAWTSILAVELTFWNAYVDNPWLTTRGISLLSHRQICDVLNPIVCMLFVLGPLFGFFLDLHGRWGWAFWLTWATLGSAFYHLFLYLW
jgi:hypothetical protein